MSIVIEIDGEKYFLPEPAMHMRTASLFVAVEQLKSQLAAEKDAYHRTCERELDYATQLAKAKEKNRWIPVGERLPENPEHGFIEIEMLQDGITPHGGYLEGFYKNGASAGRPCFRDSNGCTVNNVTHWRPTTLPKGDKI